MAATAVTLTGVWASRGGRTVLGGVSLDVAEGETVALVGRSGSGKTTLLRLVNRLIEPDRGRLTVSGRDVQAWDVIDLRRHVGYVIQETGLFPHFTVAANVALVPRLLQWPEDEVRARVSALLAMVGLDADTYGGRWPDELSGGQRQRVGLARALAADPAVLLMDEPFGALDPLTRRELHVEFIRLQGTLRRAVLIVTHDMEEACALADRVAVLHEGEIIACDTPDALAAAADPRVHGLFGPKAAP